MIEKPLTKRRFPIWFIFLLIAFSGLVLYDTSRAQDTEPVKSESTSIIGKIVYRYDYSEFTYIVYIIEYRSGRQVRIDYLKRLKGDFKEFVVKAQEENWKVKLTGLLEYRGDALVMKPSHIRKYKQDYR